MPNEVLNAYTKCNFQSEHPVMLYIQLAVDWKLTSELLIALGCSRVVSDFLDPMFFAPLTIIFLISESTTLTPEANTTHFPTSKGNQRSVADPDSPRPSSSTLSSLSSSSSSSKLLFRLYGSGMCCWTQGVEY